VASQNPTHQIFEAGLVVTTSTVSNILKIFQENRCGKATSSKSKNDKQLTKRKYVVVQLEWL